MTIILSQTLEERTGMKLGLEHLQAYKNLTSQFDSIHIAGTNGKGSVATKLAAAFPNKKVGLFTSPHIHTYHERIQINGEQISEDDALRILSKLEGFSYFEMLTLLAFTYFAEQKVDLAVIEVGLGGRLDATNILKPILSIITSIDFDHMDYLGDTLEEIAYEKGGIIKPGIPVVLGPKAQPFSVFEKLADEVLYVEGDFKHFEEENQAIAKRALQYLGVEADVLKAPKCRFELFHGVLFDVAHNPAALKRLFERIKYSFPGKKVRAVVAFSKDKNVAENLKVIERNAQAYQVANIEHERAYHFENAPSLKSALLDALSHDELVVVCGTFFMMSDAQSIVEKALSPG